MICLHFCEFKMVRCRQRDRRFRQRAWFCTGTRGRAAHCAPEYPAAAGAHVRRQDDHPAPGGWGNDGPGDHPPADGQPGKKRAPIKAVQLRDFNPRKNIGIVWRNPANWIPDRICLEQIEKNEKGGKFNPQK